MESHFCIDCRQTGPLNRKGCCGTCGSQAVVSEYAGNLTSDYWREWLEDAEETLRIAESRQMNKFDESFLRAMNISVQ